MVLEHIISNNIPLISMRLETFSGCFHWFGVAIIDKNTLQSHGTMDNVNYCIFTTTERREHNGLENTLNTISYF